MINFWMELTERPASEKIIVRLSYRIVNAKKFKAMSNNQKRSLVQLITRFESCLKVTKEEIKKSIK